MCLILTLGVIVVAVSYILPYTAMLLLMKATRSIVASSSGKMTRMLVVFDVLEFIHIYIANYA